MAPHFSHTAIPSLRIGIISRLESFWKAIGVLSFRPSTGLIFLRNKEMVKPWNKRGKINANKHYLEPDWPPSSPSESSYSVLDVGWSSVNLLELQKSNESMSCQDLQQTENFSKFRCLSFESIDSKKIRTASKEKLGCCHNQRKLNQMHVFSWIELVK